MRNYMSYLPISGVILTKHARDTRQGIELSYWVKSHDQVYHVCVPEQEAIFFIESHQLAQVKRPYHHKTSSIIGQVGWR